MIYDVKILRSLFSSQDIITYNNTYIELSDRRSHKEFSKLNRNLQATGSFHRILARGFSFVTKVGR